MKQSIFYTKSVVVTIAVILITTTELFSRMKFDTELGCYNNIYTSAASYIERELPTAGLSRHEILVDPICIGFPSLASEPHYADSVYNPNSTWDYPTGCPDGNDIICCYKIKKKENGSFCSPLAIKSYEITEVYFQGLN